MNNEIEMISGQLRATNYSPQILVRNCHLIN